MEIAPATAGKKRGGGGGSGKQQQQGSTKDAKQLGDSGSYGTA